MFSDVVGSQYYVAPEVLCKNYGQEANVWGAEVILLSGVPPFWAGEFFETFSCFLFLRIMHLKLLLFNFAYSTHKYTQLRKSRS